MPMIAAADYRATGDPRLSREHFQELKGKLLIQKARGDGLLNSKGIIDWPEWERDHYNLSKGRMLGPEINTVVNAFSYHALTEMAFLAVALHEDSEARDLERRASQVRESFNRVFFNPSTSLYTDGEGSPHSSLHANMFALAFGLVPPDRVEKVADFVQSRGMACSVYGAQYLLEALFATGREEAAIRLMASKGDRGWQHMIDLGSTMTLEAWDPVVKPNLTWNHAWGAAPANIISRFILGVRSLEPGYRKILIAPRLGNLNWAKGTVPTPYGAVGVSWLSAPPSLEIEVPPGTTARVLLPPGLGRAVTLDGHSVAVGLEKDSPVLDGLPLGHHTIDGGGRR